MNDVQTMERRVTARERRTAAPHPGPEIARDYLAPLGLDARVFAALVGMDGDRLDAMLAGTMSLDVDAAVRFGRALGLGPHHIMRAQMRHDFARSRATELEQPSPPADYFADRLLPTGAVRGHLARTEAAESQKMFYFVADPGTNVRETDMARAHPLRTGDRLRVFAADGSAVWCGPILRNLDGSPLFAFVPQAIWAGWFAAGAAAEFVPAEG